MTLHRSPKKVQDRTWAINQPRSSVDGIIKHAVEVSYLIDVVIVAGTEVEINRLLSGTRSHGESNGNNARGSDGRLEFDRGARKWEGCGPYVVVGVRCSYIVSRWLVAASGLSYLQSF